MSYLTTTTTLLQRRLAKQETPQLQQQEQSAAAQHSGAESMRDMLKRSLTHRSSTGSFLHWHRSPHKKDHTEQQHEAEHQQRREGLSALRLELGSAAAPPTAASRSLRSWKLRRLRGAISEYKWVNMLDLTQAVVGVMSAFLWMVQTYDEYGQEQSIYVVQFVLSMLYIADMLLRVSGCGVDYVLSRWAILDVLSVLPVMWILYQLGWLPTNTTGQDGFVAFVTALAIVWQWLILARFIRVYKLLRIAELRRFALWSNHGLSLGLLKLLLTVVTIIVLGGALVFLLENSLSGGTTMSFNQSLYFMVVTISTVGYGDITPHTVLGQCAVMAIILIAIIVIPWQTSELITNLSEYSKYGSAYRSRYLPHVVLVAQPTITSEDLDTLLHEFFHGSQGATQPDLVILCSNGGEEHRRKLLYHLKSKPYWSQIHYVVGTPSSVSHLQKAAISQARACILFTSGRFLNPEQELAADEETLLRAICVKAYCPKIPLILHMLSPRNRQHVLWMQLAPFSSSIRVVCLKEIRMQLLAASCMCPGMLGLMTNLLTSYDGKASLGTLFSSSSISGDAVHSSFLAKSTRSFGAAQLISHPLNLSSWPLTSHKPADLSDEGFEDVASPPSAAVGRPVLRRWEEEYLFGFGQELYTDCFPACCRGCTFSEAAAAIYERLSVVVIAVFQQGEEKGAPLRIIFNPGHSVIIDPDRDVACIIAHNAEHAAAMSIVSYPTVDGTPKGRASIAQRWQAERAQHRAAQREEERSVDHQPLAIIIEPGHAAASKVGVDEPMEDGLRAASSPFHCDGQDIAPSMNALVNAEANEQDAASGQPSNEFESPASVPGWDKGAEEEKYCPPNPTAAIKSEPVSFATGPVPEWPSRSSSPLAAESELDADPFHDHLVICGYIDISIINFIRRLRDGADHRPIVLMFDDSVCAPLSQPVSDFIHSEFNNVSMLQIADSQLSRHEQELRLYAAYALPCYGHSHDHAGHARNNSSSEDDAGSLSRRHGRDAASPVSLGVGGRGGHVMSNAEMLSHANWLRRACVHRAHAVLILANPYTPPAGVGSAAALSRDDNTFLSQQMLSSLLACSSAGSSTGDELVRADRYGLILYSSIQRFLLECQSERCCPSLPRMQVSTLDVVSIELLHHSNIRLFKHDGVKPPEKYRGLRTKQSALATLASPLRKGLARWKEQGLLWYGRLRNRATEQPLSGTAAASAAVADAQLGEDEALERKMLRKEDASFSRHLEQHYKALYTADGRVFSGRILDALVVFAFARTLEYDAVLALIGGYTHHHHSSQPHDPARDDALSSRSQRSNKAAAGDDAGAAAAQRLRQPPASFRVELMLSDLKDWMVGRTYGFVTLRLMLQSGYVAMGLYRDKEEVIRLRKASRNQAAAARRRRRRSLSTARRASRVRQPQEADGQRDLRLPAVHAQPAHARSVPAGGIPAAPFHLVSLPASPVGSAFFPTSTEAGPPSSPPPGNGQRLHVNADSTRVRSKSDAAGLTSSRRRLEMSDEDGADDFALRRTLTMNRTVERRLPSPWITPPRSTPSPFRAADKMTPDAARAEAAQVQESSFCQQDDDAEVGGRQEMTYDSDSDWSTSSYSDSGWSSSSEDEEERAAQQSSAQDWRSRFYVLTNPPPDTILHAQDRLYILVQQPVHEPQSSVAQSPAQRPQRTPQPDLPCKETSTAEQLPLSPLAETAEKPELSAEPWRAAPHSEKRSEPLSAALASPTDVRQPPCPAPSALAIPVSPVGGAAPVLVDAAALQSMQRQMLEAIQKQLSDMFAQHSSRDPHSPQQQQHPSAASSASAAAVIACNMEGGLTGASYVQRTDGQHGDITAHSSHHSHAHHEHSRHGDREHSQSHSQSHHDEHSSTHHHGHSSAHHEHRHHEHSTDHQHHHVEHHSSSISSISTSSSSSSSSPHHHEPSTGSSGPHHEHSQHDHHQHRHHEHRDSSPRPPSPSSASISPPLQHPRPIHRSHSPTSLHEAEGLSSDGHGQHPPHRPHPAQRASPRRTPSPSGGQLSLNNQISRMPRPASPAPSTSSFPQLSAERPPGPPIARLPVSEFLKAARSGELPPLRSRSPVSRGRAVADSQGDSPHFTSPVAPSTQHPTETLSDVPSIRLL